jgi:hypothetical protein
MSGANIAETPTQIANASNTVIELPQYPVGKLSACNA